MTSSRTIFFCFANPRGFSGQKAATLLAMAGLRARGWDCREIHQPVLDRETGENALAKLRYLVGLVRAWTKALPLLLARDATLNVNLGQTRFGMLRDAVPVALARLGGMRIVISLHGSVFMTWTRDSREARQFLSLLRFAAAVTVLGRRQRQHLIDWGIRADRIVDLPNTCEIDPLSVQQVMAKHGSPRTIQLLHLSSLVASKGFPEFLESVALLQHRATLPIAATLCGLPMVSEFDARFTTAASVTNWIAEKIDRIGPERVTWVKGAVEERKRNLYICAHIFVFPSRYAVEAQPLVLLEAMAAGCAIITTRVGEIERILGPNEAYFLNRADAAELTEAIALLARDSELRSRLATAACRRFIAEFSKTRHIDAWEGLLEWEKDI